MSADADTAQRTVILCYHVVLTLRNGASDRIVFVLVIHNDTPFRISGFI